MSVESHLAELERRHRLLEQEIEDRKVHPAEDELKITELKRQKLKLRDEMARLRGQVQRIAKH